MKQEVIQGKVSYNWSWIFGSFRIGKHRVQTGNMIRVLALKGSEWAKVRVCNGEVKEIMDCK